CSRVTSLPGRWSNGRALRSIYGVRKLLRQGDEWNCPKDYSKCSPLIVLLWPQAQNYSLTKLRATISSQRPSERAKAARASIAGMGAASAAECAQCLWLP